MAKKILVVYGSKYGATEEIALHIGTYLRKSGVEATVLKAEKGIDLTLYDGVVIGSAIYIGLWRENVTRFVKRNLEELGRRPIWIFVSGPLGEGDPNQLVEGWYFPKAIKPLIEQIKPKTVTAFGGKVDPDALSGLERWMMKKTNSATGDYRNWEDIDRWTQLIVEELSETK